jgi:predicted acylesterase/phospholipase RssA
MLMQAKKATGPCRKYGLKSLFARQRAAAAMPCRHRHWAFRTALLLVLVAMTACTGRERLAAVPSALTEQATVLGIANARFWADTQGHKMVEEAMLALARERAALIAPPGHDALPDAALGSASYLAVSGGGDNGAFGAGLLVGWSENGTRPSFKLVTGISTGALIAPFAFLGSAYDAQLRAVYTDITPSEVYQQRWLIEAVFNDALSNSAPLFQLISRYANADLLAAIAREYRKGRVLLIGTTNLDEQRPIIWNIGAIAASGQPGALDLFRKILLASASIPGVFPPVMIDVEAGGHRYQEMHVDGGAVAQTFLLPVQVTTLFRRHGNAPVRDRHAYVIRNGRLDPEWSSVDRRLLSITGRAIATMIHYSGYNDVFRLYTSSQRDGIDFNLAYIGKDFTTERKENFDQAYMRSLFEYGYRQARNGYHWFKQPPVMDMPDGRPNVDTESSTR